MTLKKLSGLFLHDCPVKIHDPDAPDDFDAMKTWDLDCFLRENPAYEDRKIEWLDMFSFTRDTYLRICLTGKGE